MKTHLIIFLCTGLFAISCNSDQQKTEKTAKDHEVLDAVDKKPSLEALEKQIQSAETKAQKEQNVKNTEELIALYLDFVEFYPEHEKSSEYLYRAAMMTNSVGENVPNGKPYFKKSVELLQRYQDDYPENKQKAYLAKTTQATILDLELEEDEEAIRIYKELIAEYPNSQQVSEWEFRIDHIDWTLEDVILNNSQPE